MEQRRCTILGHDLRQHEYSSQAQAENLHLFPQVTCQTPMQLFVEGVGNHDLVLLVSLVLFILLVK
jgi:hypothetical protein